MKIIKSFMAIIGFLFIINPLGTVQAATDCSPPAQTDIPQAECETLVALYNSTDGANWTDAATNGWNQNNSPCRWSGVNCTSIPGNVHEINRFNKNLIGTIPDLNALTSLQDIRLQDNQLIGNIPDLSNLRK